MGMDLPEIILEAEDQFGIVIPDSEWAGIRKVDDLYWLVLSELQNSRTGAPETQEPGSPAEVWAALVGIVAEQLNIPAELVHPEARLIEDLGCD